MTQTYEQKVLVASLNDRSLQSIFDEVLDGLRKQGVKSMIGDSCMYRGRGDTKCALGLLIPDDAYAPTMENRLLGCMIAEDAPFYGLDVEKKTLLIRLQQSHDGYMPSEGRDVGMSMFEDRMRTVAYGAGLDYQAPVA